VLAEQNHAVPLSVLDLRALRGADTVHFYHESKSCITTVQQVKNRRDVEPVDEFHYVSVNSKIQTDLANDQFDSGFHMILNAQSHEVWQTVCQLLRRGDLLELVFAADAGTNSNLMNRDLHGDHLHLVVRRGQRKMVFLLAERVCPNDTTRMMQK